MNQAEEAAKTIIERALPGARPEFRAEQSNGEYDFDLRYPDGTTAAQEATSSIDQSLTQTNTEIWRRTKDRPAIATSLCRNTWIVFPAPGAEIKKILKMADRLLANLESEGILAFDSINPGIGSSASLRTLCTELQLIRGSSIASFHGPGQILIGYAGRGGAVGASTAIEAAEKEAWKTDNRNKLGKANTAERHLFVYVHRMNGLRMNSPVWLALDEFDPPRQVPRLPIEITDLWLATANRAMDEFIVWKGTSTMVWTVSKFRFR